METQTKLDRYTINIERLHKISHELKVGSVQLEAIVMITGLLLFIVLLFKNNGIEDFYTPLLFTLLGGIPFAAWYRKRPTLINECENLISENDSIKKEINI